MIDTLHLKFGSAPGERPASIPCGPTTVFIGPNNSGKSKVLTEVERFCVSGSLNVNDRILDYVEFESLSQEDALRELERIELPPRLGETLSIGQMLVGRRGTRARVDQALLLRLLQSGEERRDLLAAWYLKWQVAKLDGARRLSLASQQDGGDLLLDRKTTLQVLFSDRDLREMVRSTLYEALGLYFVIDPTLHGKLRVRYSSVPPVSDFQECGLHGDALRFHSNATLLDEMSDGVKAFTGLIVELIAGDPGILLLDEPEAFLHPALAYRLGVELARASGSDRKRLIVATHSAEFLMGCVQSGVPVSVVRLEYRGGIASARVLPSRGLREMMQNPLLRSTGVLASLFHQSVVVAEGDADRAFYQEVNERLLRAEHADGIRNCLFMNAHNKQTVASVVGPLRSLGVPAAAVVDLDLVKDGAPVWRRLLQAVAVPEIEMESLMQARSAIGRRLSEVDGAGSQSVGINALTGDDLEAALNLLSRLSQYGLFLVPVGELEHWLPHLGIGGHSSGWLRSMFERMGDNPTDEEYVHPSQGDVWQFVGQIGTWLRDAGRRGLRS